MNAELRPLLIVFALASACSSKAGSALFSDVPSGPDGAGAQPGSAGSGAASAGGTQGSGASTSGGGSGAAPTNAGSESGGTANPTDAGAPSTPGGDAGAADGEAGSPAVTPAEPVCGNGKLEEGEECDDAGHVGEDGCTNQCQVNCAHFGADTLESADHHCYNGYDSATWEGAVAACKAMGAHLVTIASAAEDEIAGTFVKNSKFIGASDGEEVMSDTEGSYTWVTGEPLTYDNWGSGEPELGQEHCTPYNNSPRCYRHCAYLTGDGDWAAQRCDNEDGYICEWEPAGK